MSCTALTSTSSFFFTSLHKGHTTSCIGTECWQCTWTTGCRISQMKAMSGILAREHTCLPKVCISVFITARIKWRMCVCACHQQVCGPYGIYSTSRKGGSPAEFIKRRTFSSRAWRWHIFNGVQTHVEEGWVLRHLVQPNHRVGFITSEARLRFRLILAKWTIESRSGPRFPAEHKVTLSSIKPYVCQMLLAWVPFKETIKHNYRNI